MVQTSAPTSIADVARRPDAEGYDLTLIARDGQEVSLDCAVNHWRRAVLAFLAHGAETPERLSAALAAVDQFPLAELAKGFFMLLLGRAELRSAADDALARTTPLAAVLTSRETALLAALRDYRAGMLRAAADRIDAALIDHPRDPLMMKLVHGIRFVIGDADGMRRSVEAVLGAYDRCHPSRGYALGCHAFALEETGAYVAAERAGREAVATAPNDAWGLHAVAHVMDMTNRTTEGVAWIAKRRGGWRHCNNFGHHISWHLALFHLDRGEISEVLRLYDQEIRRDQSDDYRDVSNAASLLARLELEGVNVGDRWDELAALAETRVDDGCVVFADLHYMLALGGGGRPAAEARLLAQLRAAGARDTARKGRDGATGGGDHTRCMEAAAATAGAPAAAGLRAFAAGAYAEAYDHLAAARPEMARVGGSHAQRDVFERLTIEAGLRAGRLLEARRTLQDRARRRGALDRYTEVRLARIAELEASAAVAAE